MITRNSGPGAGLSTMMRKLPSYDYGIIESIVLQGDIVFATVRRFSSVKTNPQDGSSVEIKGELYGEFGPNPTASECLIRVDIPAFLITSSTTSLIGNRTKVNLTKDGVPTSCSVVSSEVNSRIIPRSHMMLARLGGENMDIKSEGARLYLTERLGYDEDLVSAIIEETPESASTSLHSYNSSGENEVSPETEAISLSGAATGITPEAAESIAKMRCPAPSVFKG